MSRHSDTNSVESQVEKLDILTINAERRAYLTHFLNSYNEDNTGKKFHPKVDLENPNGSSSSGIPHVSGPSSVGSSHSNESSNKQSKFKFFRKRRTHNGGVNSNDSDKYGTGKSSSSGKSDSSSVTSNDDQVVVEEEMSNDDIKKITITKLPQLFLAKYLGSTPCTGVKGLNVIRNPIDRLIDAVGRLKMGDDLPLVNVVVSGTGIRVDRHYLNRGINIDSINFPIESISYGVQDVKFCRVYAFIVIQEATSSRVKKAECHAFVCSSPVAARKISLSLGLSYQSLTRRIVGQEVYSVDLRTPEELSRIRSSTLTCEADA